VADRKVNKKVMDADLQRYIHFFEGLTPDKLERLSEVMTDDVHFVDPFNDVVGTDKVRLIFEHMFRTLESPRFCVTHAASVAGPGRSALLRWELHAHLKTRSATSMHITGMSEIHLAEDGRVREHIDHWDSGQQFYERIPLIGWVLRRIRGTLKV
jgi:steroid delta-isomerase